MDNFHCLLLLINIFLNLERASDVVDGIRRAPSPGRSILANLIGTQITTLASKFSVFYMCIAWVLAYNEQYGLFS